MKTGISFHRINKVTKFHGKYEVTIQEGDHTFTLTFNEDDITKY